MGGAAGAPLAQGSGAEGTDRLPPEVRGSIDALVAALSAGDPAAYERLAQERFTPQQLARRTAEERRQFLTRFHGDFGALRVAAIRPAGPWSADVEVRPAAAGTLAGMIHLELTADPPHRIGELAINVRQGGDDGPKTALPPVPEVRGVTDSRRLAAALDPYLGKLAADDTLSGVVLIGYQGKTVYQGAFGAADRERHAANTIDTRFNLASIGKQFTKLAIGQLLEQGKLDLDAPIGKHLPGYPNAEAAQKATIRQLLEHRGGIPDIFEVRKESDPAPRSNHEWFELVAPRPLKFEPGSQARYCNGCYVVLGEIVARVTGMTYEAYLAQNVFAAAGMSSAAFLDGSTPEERKARGYTRKPEGLVVASLGQGGRGCGAGGVFATAADLLSYDNALRGYHLVDRERTAWMLGGGGAAEGRATGALGAAGGAPGTNTLLSSDGTWTVVVLTNRDPRVGEDLGEALARALRGAPQGR